MEEFPDEIRLRPVPLVAFMGAGKELATAIERFLPLSKRHQSDPVSLPSFRIASFDLREPLPSQKKPGVFPLSLPASIPLGSSPGLAVPALVDPTRRVSQDHSLTQQPNGILKGNWLSKVRSRRYAGVVAFVDWEDFKTREPEVYAAIDSLKYVEKFSAYRLWIRLFVFLPCQNSSLAARSRFRSLGPQM